MKQRAGTQDGGGWKPQTDSGAQNLGVAALLGVLISAPFLGVTAWYTLDQYRRLEEERRSRWEAANAYEMLIAAAPKEPIPQEVAIKGREVFATVCATCHGMDGLGGVGKDLVHSDFVARLSDAEFKDYIIQGRPNAQPPMPPRAGRPDLTDEDLMSVVAYVRGLQDPRRMPELPELVLALGETTEAERQAALSAAGGDEELAQYIASGKKIFETVCIACHGPEGVGIPGNGKALAKNEFIRSLDDDALLAFIKKGRDPGDPKNTTGVAMPPKGGNPALSDDDILDVIAYLRTLQGMEHAGTP
jgi:mono/diheme cytochrome c family protein